MFDKTLQQIKVENDSSQYAKELTEYWQLFGNCPNCGAPYFMRRYVEREVERVEQKDLGFWESIIPAPIGLSCLASTVKIVKDEIQSNDMCKCKKYDARESRT